MFLLCVSNIGKRALQALKTELIAVRPCYPNAADPKISREEARKRLSASLFFLEQNKESATHLHDILETLKQYDSSHGIPSKKIVECFCHCISEFISIFHITDQDFQNKTSKIRLIHEIILVIWNKFPNKIAKEKVKSHWVHSDLKDFSYFIEQLIFSRQDISIRHDFQFVKEILTRFISFQLQFEIDQTLIEEDSCKKSEMLSNYNKFCRQFRINTSDSLLIMIQFISKNRHDLHNHTETMNSLFSFMEHSFSFCQQSIPHEFEYECQRILDQLIHFNLRPRHEIVHHVQLISKFAEYLPHIFKKNIPLFLRKIKLRLYSDTIGKKFLTHDYVFLLKLFEFILRIENSDFKIPVVNSLIDDIQKTKSAYRLISQVSFHSAIPLTSGQMKKLIPIVFNEVKNNFSDVNELEQESLYEIISGFCRLGNKDFHSDLSHLAKKCATEAEIYVPPDSKAGIFLKNITRELEIVME